MPRSNGMESAARKSHNVATRARSSRFRIAREISRAAGPETRTTPMPARPGAVAIAAMVSACDMSGFGTLDHARDLPLLRNRQNVIHQPVKHQPGWKEEKEHTKSHRHYFHDFGLDRIRGCRIQVGLDDHGGAHQYRQNIVRILGGQILYPPDERRVSKLHARQQYPVKRDEDRNLNHDGQATAKRIYFFGLVHFNHRLMQTLAVVSVLFL